MRCVIVFLNTDFAELFFSLEYLFFILLFLMFDE